MPMFLHASLVHIACNVVSQLIIGTVLEDVMGPMKIAILYFVSGLGGILFSSLCSDAAAVGASTSIMGLSGAFVSYLILNWKLLENRRE